MFNLILLGGRGQKDKTITGDMAHPPDTCIDS
jgi:hypothetical protein